MTTINRNNLTKEQIQKAMACETAEELMAMAKAEGYEITEEEAEAYLDELSCADLDEEQLAKVARGAGRKEGCDDFGLGNSCDLTSEQIQRAMACETAEELMAMAKAEGYEITEEEAEAYLDELSCTDLDEEQLAKVAGGVKWCINCGDQCAEQTKFW